jgi:hypothetical protein
MPYIHIFYMLFMENHHVCNRPPKLTRLTGFLCCPEIVACEEVSHITLKFGGEYPEKLVPRSLKSFLPLHKISVQIDTTVFLSKGSSEIATSIHKPALIKKVERDTKWPQSVDSLVDWQALGKVFGSFSKLTRIKFTKLMFDLNQTNYLYNKFY